MAKPNDDDNNDTLHTQGLSEEEIAALSDDNDDVDAADLAELAGDDDDDVDNPAAADADNDDLDDDDDLDEDPPAKAADTKPAASVAADDTTTAAADSDDDVGAPEFRSVYTVEPVQDFDGKMAAFKAQKDALRAQFTDGEIDIDKFDESKDAIVAQEQALREQQLKYTIAVEQNEQNNIARWNWEQDRFFESEANAIYKNKLVMASLDTAVKDLANQPENANRPAAWFLKEADRQVREAMGLTAAPAADKKKDPPPSRKPDLTKIPPNLGGLPAAEVAETGTGEFAHLENLDGIKLEQALAKLTPDEQARYLEAA
jgi:hypothetical protein